MKFVSAKKPTDYANRLKEIKDAKHALRQQMKDLKAEEEAIEQFLYDKSGGENFRFNGADDYMMELDFQERHRFDLDDKRIRLDYARMGKKVPMKKTEWIQTAVKYVTEDMEEAA